MKYSVHVNQDGEWLSIELTAHGENSALSFHKQTGFHSSQSVEHIQQVKLDIANFILATALAKD